MLNEILIGKCKQIDSSSEKRGATANEVLDTIKKFVSSKYALIHDQEHIEGTGDNESYSCPNIEKSPNYLVTSIEEKVERINEMLYDLTIIASDAANGNVEISKDEIKLLLEKLVNHQCQGEKSEKESNEDGKSQIFLDLLALNKQLMHLEEYCSKYEKDRKERSLRYSCKLAIVRSLVEQ